MKMRFDIPSRTWPLAVPGLIAMVVLWGAGCSPSSKGGGGTPVVFDAGDVTSDAENECEFGEIASGFCSPAPPRSTPVDQCPSGRRTASEAFQGDGICLPEYPETADWECPETWNETPAFVDSEGKKDVPKGVEPFHYCEPPELPEHCSVGQMPILGETECQPVGLECPAPSDWFHDEQTIRERASRFDGDIIYADARSDDPGDGTEQSPYQTVAAAIAQASAGDIVALAPVQFEEHVAIEEPIALVGSCPSKSRITAPSPTTSVSEPSVEVRAAGSTLSDLTVTGDRVGIVLATAGNEPIRVPSVAVHEARTIGVVVASATASFRRLSVTNTAPHPDGEFGFGVKLQQGARGTFRETSLEENGEQGMVVEGSDTIVENATDFVVRETRARPTSGRGGMGVSVSEGASATFRRTLLDRNRHNGLYVFGENTALEASELVVRRTRPRRDNDEKGTGITVRGGSEITLDQTLLEANHTFGLSIDGAREGEKRMTDVVIRRTQPQPSDGKLGLGAYYVGQNASFERLLLSQNHSVGLLVTDGQTELKEARDVVAWRTQPRRSDRKIGVGISVRSGATAAFRRALIEENFSKGVAFQGKGTTVEAFSDATIRETRGRGSDDSLGYGMDIHSGARVEMRRVSLEENRSIGIGIRGAESNVSEATDVVIRRTRPNGATGNDGMGLSLIEGAEAAFHRTLVADNRTVGIVLTGPSTTLRRLEDVVVRGTKRNAYVGGFGYGIMLEEGASMRLKRGILTENRTISLLAFGANTSIDLASHLVIRDTIPKDATNFGDGVHVVQSGSMTLNRTFIGSNERNGMVFSGAAGSKVSNSAITDNQIGVSLQRENDIEFVDTRIVGNERKNRRCEEQCYEEPESPGRVDPSGDN